MSRLGLDICTDRSSDEMRRLARRQASPAASARMYAIANALDGMSRAEAARLAGMERQALRDAVVRYNAEGLDGLHDRPRSGRKPRLTQAEQAALAKLITDGPDVEASGLSAWTLSDLCVEIKQRWAKTLHPASLSRVVRKLGFSRQKARQVHPQSDKEAQQAFQKGGFRRRSTQRVKPIQASA
jgi:transposase